MTGKDHSLDEYKIYTRKLKAKLRYLQSKNEEFMVKIAEIKAVRSTQENWILINYSVLLNKCVTKVQVSLIKTITN
jgi:hypothetical protein